MVLLTITARSTIANSALKPYKRIIGNDVDD